MTTEARTRANRENALKSTGPRTEAGKARSRLNALKHGRRSRTAAAPVLPHEDAADLAMRIREWIESHEPVGAVETELVTRAAKASWALDRAERHETALLARRVRRALVNARSHRAAMVCDLGRKLLYMAGKRVIPGLGPDWTDDPAAFVAELESIPEGARWLRDRWSELHNLIIADEPWTYLDQFKFIRLLGKQPFEAVDNPAVNAVFLAWEAIEEGWGVRFWKLIQENTPYEDPAFSAWRVWRVVSSRPVDRAAGIAHLLAVANHEIRRLEDRIAELDDAESDDAVETAERASFSPGDGAERLRRFQAARSRELLRSLDTLNRLRKESASRDKKTSKAANPTKPTPSLQAEFPVSTHPEPDPEPTPPPSPPPVAIEPTPAPEVRAIATSAPTKRKAKAAARAVVVAIDADEAPATFRLLAEPADASGADAIGIKLLGGSRRAETHSIRANEAKLSRSQPSHQEELAWSRCNPFPRERTHAADPGLRRRVVASVAGDAGKARA